MSCVPSGNTCEAIARTSEAWPCKRADNTYGDANDMDNSCATSGDPCDASWGHQAHSLITCYLTAEATYDDPYADTWGAGKTLSAV